MNKGLTHFDETGAAVMVDVSEKDVTTRTALAEGRIRLTPSAYQAVVEGSAKKGDVLGVARLAGILGAKKTSDIIPLCHLLPLAKCSIDFIMDEAACAVVVRATVKTVARTGVEMEALHAASVALLTIYDMLKAVTQDMTISDIRLLEKSGGRSGHYQRD